MKKMLSRQEFTDEAADYIEIFFEAMQEGVGTPRKKAEECADLIARLATVLERSEENA